MAVFYSLVLFIKREKPQTQPYNTQNLNTRGPMVMYSKLRGRMFRYPSGKHVRVIYYPLQPHFYIVKLGFAGVYIFFLFFFFYPKHRSWVLGEAVLLTVVEALYSLSTLGPCIHIHSIVYPQSVF